MTQHRAETFFFKLIRLKVIRLKVQNTWRTSADLVQLAEDPWEHLRLNSLQWLVLPHQDLIVHKTKLPDFPSQRRYSGCYTICPTITATTS